MFSEQELAYLESQPLARLATVSDQSQPDAVPVGFEFDGEAFYIGGHKMERSRKYKNVKNGNERVALVIDDLETVDPWKPRGVKIFGTAEIVERQEGYAGSGPYLRIDATTTWSWGIDGPVFVNDEFKVNKRSW